MTSYCCDPSKSLNRDIGLALHSTGPTKILEQHHFCQFTLSSLWYSNPVFDGLGELLARRSEERRGGFFLGWRSCRGSLMAGFKLNLKICVLKAFLLKSCIFMTHNKVFTFWPKHRCRRSFTWMLWSLGFRLTIPRNHFTEEHSTVSDNHIRGGLICTLDFYTKDLTRQSYKRCHSSISFKIIGSTIGIIFIMKTQLFQTIP